MPQAVPSSVASPPPFDSLPYCVEHHSSRIAALLLLALLVAMAGLVIVPAGLVLAYAAHDVREALLHKPLAVSVLAVGLVIWTSLLAAAAARVLRRSWSDRSISITPERVVVREIGLIGATLWSRPLGEFRGIAHHVRATLTGVRHELILLHSVRSRSLLLHSADTLSQATIDRAAGLLQLPQIPARELYRLTKAGGHSAGPSPAMPPLPEAARAA